MNLNFKIVNLEELKVIGLQFNSDSKDTIKNLWNQFAHRYHEIKNINNFVFYGVFEMVGPDYNEMTYLAACPVDDLSIIPEGMVGKIIPAGKYAVFTHIGKLDTLSQTYEYIYGDWAMQSGYKLRPAPEFELYDHRFKFDQDDSELDIYIPIH